MRWPALPERARAQGSPPPRRRAGPEGASRAYRHRPVPWRRRQRKRPDRGQADNDPRIIATDADGDGRERRSHKALMTVWSNCCSFHTGPSLDRVVKRARRVHRGQCQTTDHARCDDSGPRRTSRQGLSALPPIPIRPSRAEFCAPGFACAPELSHVPVGRGSVRLVSRDQRFGVADSERSAR